MTRPRPAPRFAMPLEREQDCTCRMSAVHATDTDPPHEVVDEWCPVHGRDPDAEADRRAEDREAEREMDDCDGGDDE